MSELERCEHCIVCGTDNPSVLVTRESLEQETRFRDGIFRRAMGGTPEHMLEDLTTFTNAYPSQLDLCNNCGLIWRDPRFKPEASVQAYARDRYSPEWLEKTFGEYYAAYSVRIPRLAKRIGRTAAVLELGSYVGGFLAAAKDFGWQAQGVDVGRQVSNFARSKGLDVFTGKLAEVGFAPSIFDAVFVWACFDQLPDPWNELEEIHRILKPAGWLYVQVPNGDFVKMIQRAWNLLPRQSSRAVMLKLLAYSGLAGFPYQVGHTRATLNLMLRTSGFSSIKVRNQINIWDTAGSKSEAIPEQQVYLLWTHRIVSLLYLASVRRLVKGPWIQASGRKV